MADRGSQETDYFLTIPAPDPRKLAQARRDRERLESYEGIEPVFLRRMGRNLFQIAFPDWDQRQSFADAWAAAANAQRTFRLWVRAETPELRELPWEFLCLTDDVAPYLQRLGLRTDQPFLVLNPGLSLVRWTQTEPPDRPLERIGALRVLVVWANPATKPWPDVPSIELEPAAIAEALKGLPPSHVELRILPHATADDLERKVGEWKPNVLHWIGHGAFPGARGSPGDLREPALVLENPAGGSCYYGAAALRELCTKNGVSVVVLNCCWGAKAAGATQGLAWALSMADSGEAVPVVVAHQAPWPQYAAPGFAGSLYRYLGVTLPVEEAVHHWRRSSVAQHPLGAGVPEWGIPSVFLNVRHSELFRSSGAPDLYPLDFGPLRREHLDFVGREFLDREFDDFVNQQESGIFLLIAPPGAGKTAFVAKRLERSPATPHFFFRTAAGITEPDECVRSLCHSLEAYLGIVPDRARRLDPLEWRRLLWRLLGEASGRATDGNRCVVLVDALDEARPGVGGATILQALPLEIPRGVFFLVTSRPSDEAEELSRRAGVKTYRLNPLSDDNLRDAEEYCLRKLRPWAGGKPDSELHPLAAGLARQAEGNFLVLRLFLGPGAGFSSLKEIEGAAPSLTARLEDRYREFLARVEARFTNPLQDREVLYTVLGALVTAAAAVTKEQVCAAFHLDAACWAWAWALIRQFLMEGGVRRTERGAHTWTLFHQTFRDFLTGILRADLKRRHTQWAKWCAQWRNHRDYERDYAVRFQPEHWRLAENWNRLAAATMDLEYLESLAISAGMGEVLGQFLKTRQVFPPRHARSKDLENLHIALDQSLGALKQDPRHLIPQVRFHLVAQGRMTPALEAAFSALGSPRRLLLERCTAAEQAGGLIRTLAHHSDEVTAVAYSPDGQLLASASDDGTICLSDAKTGVWLRTLEGHGSWVMSVAFSPDGELLASGFWDGTVKLWEVGTGRCLRTLEGHGSRVNSVAFAPDGERLASGSEDKTVKLWDVAAGRCLRTLEGHRQPVMSVAFSPDGELLASGSWDSTVKLWEVVTGRCLRTLEGHHGPVTSVAFSPDSERLASGSLDNTVKLWEVATGRCLRTLEGHGSGVNSVAFAPDGQLLASGSWDSTVKLWEVVTGRCLRTLEGHRGSVESAAFSPDGERLASGSSDKTVKLWEVADGRCLRTLEGHRSSVDSVAFAPDGERLASGSYDKTVKLWEVATGRCLRTLEGHGSGVNSVAFAPDGQRLASGSWDGTVKVWEVASGRCLRTRKGHGGWVLSVASSPDGERLASGSHDGTVKLWEVATGRCLRWLKGHRSLVTSLAFSPDSERLASGSWDKTVKLWEVAGGRLLASVELPNAVLCVCFHANGDLWVADDGGAFHRPSAYLFR